MVTRKSIFNHLETIATRYRGRTLCHIHERHFFESEGQKAEYFLRQILPFKDAVYRIAQHSDRAADHLESARVHLEPTFPGLRAENPYVYFETAKTIEALFCLSLFGTVILNEIMEGIGNGKVPVGEGSRYLKFYRAQVLPLIHEAQQTGMNHKRFYEEVCDCEAKACEEFGELLARCKEGMLGLPKGAPILTDYSKQSAVSWRDRVFG